jgi:hypothetical protein
MVGVGSRSSFEWWYFQEDWSSFEFSFLDDDFLDMRYFGYYSTIYLIIIGPLLQHLSISLKPWRSDSFPTKFHLLYILVLHNGNIKEIY